MECLKVSSKSQPKLVAGALAAALKDYDRIEIQAVGAAAVNQAVKAVAITRGFLVPKGQDISMVPIFAEVVIDNERKTAIKFIVETK